MSKTEVTPFFFKTPKAFRTWLEKNHLTKTELVVGFYKVGTGKPSMTWSESVDQAICFGWIDGVRRSLDEHSYSIRFTPRKPNSIWSAVNIKKVEELTRQGLMYEAGLAIYQKRSAEKSVIYPHEKKQAVLDVSFEKQFKSNKKAWTYFQNLAPSYQKTSVDWVMRAKQSATQLKRLGELIAMSEAGTNPWKDNKYQKKKK